MGFSCPSASSTGKLIGTAWTQPALDTPTTPDNPACGYTFRILDPYVKTTHVPRPISTSNYCDDNDRYNMVIATATSPPTPPAQLYQQVLTRTQASLTELNDFTLATKMGCEATKCSIGIYGAPPDTDPPTFHTLAWNFTQE